MGKFLKILFFLFFILKTNQVYSNDLNTSKGYSDNLVASSPCNLVMKETIERYNELRLWSYFYDSDEWFSFDVDREWDRDLETWKVVTDPNGYWIVSGKVRANDYKDLKVFPGDKIVKIDGVKVQDIKGKENTDYITQEDLAEIIYPYNESEEKYIKRKINLTIIDSSNVQKDVELELFNYLTNITEFDFKIHAINSIDIKKNEVEVFFSRTSGWKNDNWIEVLVNQLIIDSTDELYSSDPDELIANYHGGCEYSEEEWNRMQVPSPGWSMVDLNASSLDLDKIQKKIWINLWSKEIGDDVEEEYVWIDEETTGVMRFQNSFKLKAFPFDKQILSFRFIKEDVVFGNLSGSITGGQQIEENLSDFVEKSHEINLVPGWDIIDYSVKNFLYKSTASTYHDGLEIKIEIQRNHEYYIFKVIFPIILILLICWSVFWIHPKELESKLTITIVCLLSLIAYNFVIEEDLPKLSYLTIMDHLVLISYIFATIPNFLSILSFRLYTGGKKLKLKLPLMPPIVMSYVQIDNLSKRWGLLTYILIMLLIILFNVKGNEYTAGYLAWLR